MIMKDLDRGVTGISARGMYSGQDKLMLFCVVNKKEIVMLKEKVDEIDPEAFVIVQMPGKFMEKVLLKKSNHKKIYKKL